MRRFLLALMIGGMAASSGYAMTVDDIIQLCQAGFTPDRIARIVDATGLDEPLQASDWARLKQQGCNDQLVDALLEVLVPTDEESGNATNEEATSESRQDHVNVYFSGGWGWNAGYSGLGYGGYDPFWSFGWTYWDPYGDWYWWNRPGYWYASTWWGYPYSHNFYCDPYYYHGGAYNGGYYSSGHYARYKASRRGSLRGSDYAQSKVYAEMQGGLGTLGGQKGSRDGLTMTSYRTLAPKSGSALSNRGDHSKSAPLSGKVYTTKNKVGESGGTSSRTALRSKSSMSPAPAVQTRTSSRYGTLKTKGTSPGSSEQGTNRGGSTVRSKSGGATSPGAYSPSPKGGDRSQPAGQSQKSGQGSTGGSRARTKR